MIKHNNIDRLSLLPLPFSFSDRVAANNPANVYKQASLSHFNETRIITHHFSSKKGFKTTSTCSPGPLSRPLVPSRPLTFSTPLRPFSTPLRSSSATLDSMSSGFECKCVCVHVHVFHTCIHTCVRVRIKKMNHRLI